MTWKLGRASNWFANEASCQIYCDYLRRFRERYSIKIHGYVLDGGKPRLSGLCQDLKSLQLYLRTVNSSFVKKIRQVGARTADGLVSVFATPDVIVAEDSGSLWPAVEKNFADFAEKKLPNHQRWNSFHHYAYGREDLLVDEPLWYLTLGRTTEQRCERYVRLIQQVLASRTKLWSRLWPSANGFSFVGQPEWLHFRLTELAILEERERQGRMQRLLCLGV